MTESTQHADADETKTEQAFENYDLKAEAPEARKPTVRFAFEFPALLALFLPADKTALAARKTSRVAGIASVLLVLAALLMASLGPILSSGHAPDPHHPPGSEGPNLHLILGLVSAALGLVGTLIGLSGMRRGASRRKWLHARLTTETLRLYHFHHIAARLPEIIAINGDAAKQARYIEERAGALERLKMQILANPEAELQRIIAREDETRFEAITPMMPVDAIETPQVAQDVFDVWRVLRVNWQAGYCHAKLEHRHKGRTTTRQLEEFFIRLGWFCVGAIILIHIGYFIGALAQTKEQLPWLEAAVIWTALFALGGRALEDGFRPQAEIERYEQYRANVRVASERFEAATTFASKVDAMRAFERTSLEEMRVFLRTHARARFLL